MFVFSRSRSSEQQTEDIPKSAYKLLYHDAPSPGTSSSTYLDEDDDDETEEFVIIA